MNDEVVHGIPSARRLLAEGDVVGLDFGVVLDGWYGDSARTVAVGRVEPRGDPAPRRRRARRSSAASRRRCPGGPLGDVGAAVQRLVEGQGFSVVRDFVGHGIGRRLHEPPHVPNFGAPGTGERLRPGMVLAIEPMVNAGGPEVEQLDDGWTAVTADGRLSAHFEHTVAVTEKGPSSGCPTPPRAHPGRGVSAGPSLRRAGVPTAGEIPVCYRPRFVAAERGGGHRVKPGEYGRPGSGTLSRSRRHPAGSSAGFSSQEQQTEAP